jgi:hypothetical protein
MTDKSAIVTGTGFGCRVHVSALRASLVRAPITLFLTIASIRRRILSRTER